jgi:hypothetical protein
MVAWTADSCKKHLQRILTERTVPLAIDTQYQLRKNDMLKRKLKNRRPLGDSIHVSHRVR